MKKFKFLLVFPLFCMAMTGCGNSSSSGGDDGGDGSQAKPLSDPVLSVNTDQNGITWAAVEGAKSYSVKVNDVASSVTTPGVAFKTEVGQYSVKVTAKAEDPKNDSKEVSFNYETKATALGALSYANAAITWASLVGTGVEAKLGDAAYAKVQGTSIAATVDGTYTARALPGWDATNKIFYVDGGQAAVQTYELNTRVPLAAPVLAVNAEKNGLTWEAVQGAVSYSVKVNNADAVTVTTPGYAFATEAGEYTVKVIAVADVPAYNSQEATYAYETKITSLGALSFNSGNGKITWASAVGTGIVAKYNDGQEAAVTGEDFQVTEPGVYTLRAKGGFDEANKIFYADSNTSMNSRAMVLQQNASAAKVIENGSAASKALLKENYTIEYYDGGQKKWVPSSGADLDLSTANSGVTEGKCVDVKYYRNGNAFRFMQKDIEYNGAYNQLSIKIRGDGYATVKVQFMITKDLIINGHNYKGVYATFDLNTVPAGWIEYDLSMEDSNWAIAYKNDTINPATMLAGLETLDGVKAYYFSQLVPYFDAINLIVQKGNSDNQESHIQFDDFQLSYNPNPVTQATILVEAVLKDTYAFSTASGAKGKLIKVGDDRYLDLGTAQLPVTVQLANNVLTMTCTVTGYDFQLTAMSFDGGFNFEYMNATGSLKDQLAGLKAQAIVVLDDFQGYSAAGTGYDQNHKSAEGVSGLRAAYYADWNQSPSSGNESILTSSWSLMGSTDYLQYTSEDGYYKNGAAKLKINSGKWMRYITSDVLEAFGADAEAWPQAKAIGFWIKGADAANNVKFRIHYAKPVTGSNVDSNDARTYSMQSVKAGSEGWKLYTVTLDQSKTYYGFSLAIENSSTNAGKYLTLDDVFLVL